MVQRQTFYPHLGKQSNKDIHIFNHFHSIMIARVDFESLWTNFYDPSALLVFFVMFFFSLLYSFFPHALNLRLPVPLYQSVLCRKYEIENLLYHMSTAHLSAK